MKFFGRNLTTFLSVVFLCIFLCACGSNSPLRFNPGSPDTPAALTATAGNGQVSLSWSATINPVVPTVYNIYYSTSPGVTTGTGTKIADIASTSTIVTGLANHTPYYFTITARNSDSESPLSNEVSVIPSEPGPFVQSDLEGTWNFNLLVTGVGAKWMRGNATIDASGNVAVNTFLDSSGNTSAPAGLFSTMNILPDGFISQTGPETDFQGTLSNNQFKDILVGSASAGGASPMIAILQKQVTGISFSASDIKGTGQAVAGPLIFVYHQLSSGVNQEWEYASGQIGSDQKVTYSSIKAPTPRQLPGGVSKVVTLAITSQGIVTETAIAGISPQPAALLKQGIMSADKMMIVGTATDAQGAFILRIMQFIHPPSIALTPSTYSLGDLAGSYNSHKLINGATPLWAYGYLSIDASGAATYASYLDSSGNSALPGAFVLAMDQQGVLTNAADQSYHGKLSFFKDMFVSTGTGPTGEYSLGIALKR